MLDILLWGVVAIPAALICMGIVTAITNAFADSKPATPFWWGYSGVRGGNQATGLNQAAGGCSHGKPPEKALRAASQDTQAVFRAVDGLPDTIRPFENTALLDALARDCRVRDVAPGFQRTVAELACVTMSMAQGNPACACASIAERR
jgi:hypothetical protein